MSSDEETPDENPILARHRKEKKELRAKALSMKKAAKSGNKQKQKETNAEIEKLEAEQQERHKKELEEHEKSNKAEGETSEKKEEEVKKEEVVVEVEEEEEDDDDATSCSKAFYKKVKISGKAAKRQQKKKEDAERMKLAQEKDKEAAANRNTEKHIEREAIKKNLSSMRLKMVEIPADGDCMYNALSHQLQEDGIEVSSRKIRRYIAQHLREHKEEYLPFVALQETPGNDGQASNWENYVLGVEHPAETIGSWGGHLELTAASRVYQKCIVVHTADGQQLVGEEFRNEAIDRPLHIVYLRKAYTLGEHYNSTCQH